MLIVALVLAVVGLAALVTAVVTSNELIAWVCIAASVIGVLLLIIDALRDRSNRDEVESADEVAEEGTDVVYDEDYPEETPVAEDFEDDPVEDVRADVDPDHHDSDTTSSTPEQDLRGEPATDDRTKS
jgi:hypothetical protein